MTEVHSKHILFLQGGGGEEDYEADSKLVKSLQDGLGGSYTIHYPLLTDGSAPDFGRIDQIDREISLIPDGVILVGHSLGASMLLKFLSERRIEKRILGIFLLSTPFWTGEESWVKALKLNDNFTSTLPENVPVFLYHCKDDEEIPIEHLARYEKKLPKAIIRKIDRGGHQLNNDLSIVAKDIKSLLT